MNVSVISNVAIDRRRRCCASVSMNTSAIANVATMQRRGCRANISKKPLHITNALTMQLGTSCSFDSPGLARNEPTPGKRLHGDSTPKVLSFFCEGIVIARGFMANYA
ncbi:tetrahydrofolate synthase [Segatella salivae]|uniref:tetrahydrofolate synthase n=1 Tax=Segatella salivae TaxID=228604 RepID=UPI00241C69A0|nr:tetrahydrofolate synthase [Segatella salivae]